MIAGKRRRPGAEATRFGSKDSLAGEGDLRLKLIEESVPRPNCAVSRKLTFFLSSKSDFHSLGVPFDLTRTMARNSLEE